ncbi:hypothetical protein B4Q13_22465, partial [Lacticaseibacillus rhamnosus]
TFACGGSAWVFYSGEPDGRTESDDLPAKDAGFNIVSKFITSPTFGGFSWFAHETLNTGFKVVSHLHSRLLQEEKPTGLGHYFRDAGYRADARCAR